MVSSLGDHDFPKTAYNPDLLKDGFYHKACSLYDDCYTCAMSNCKWMTRNSKCFTPDQRGTVMKIDDFFERAQECLAAKGQENCLKEYAKGP